MRSVTFMLTYIGMLMINFTSKNYIVMGLRNMHITIYICKYGWHSSCDTTTSTIAHVYSKLTIVFPLTAHIQHYKPYRDLEAFQHYTQEYKKKIKSVTRCRDSRSAKSI